MFLFRICSLFNIACYFCIISAKLTSKTTEVDLIIQGLQEQQWPDDETKCLQETLDILNSVKNYTLWAAWIWNSNQHPVGTFYGSKYSLGNYAQCLKASSVTGDPKVLTQYCLAEVHLTESEAGNKENSSDAFGLADHYLEVKTELGRIQNVLTWGACLPATCKPESMSKILKVVYSANPYTSSEPHIIVGHCQVAGEKPIYDRQFYVFLTFILLLLLTAISSSIYLQETKKKTRMTIIVNAFSLKRNWWSLINTNDNEIPVLNFLKTINVIMVTCCHGFYFFVMIAVSNSLDIDELFNSKVSITPKITLHFDLPVLENFFIISGYLLMKYLMEKKPNPLMFLINRYIRLIGSLTFVIFFFITTFKYVGDGPLWNKFLERELTFCEENWIWNILMLSNYVKTDRICQPHAWFIPCIYQLAIVGMCLYSICRWNRRAAIIIITFVALFAHSVPGIVTYWKQIPGFFLYDIEKINDIRTNPVFLDIYTKTHNRIGPYLLGMATGYILTVYKPHNYRGLLSKQRCYVGYTLAGILGVYAWTSADSWYYGDYNAWNLAVYAALCKNLWAVCTCIIIVITEYGDLPWIRSAMAWPGFMIISRLAYGVYITHFLIYQRMLFSQRNPKQFDIFFIIVISLGVLAVSFVCSTLLWLFIEAPLKNLANVILPSCKQKKVEGVKNKEVLNDYRTEDVSQKNKMKFP